MRCGWLSWVMRWSIEISCVSCGATSRQAGPWCTPLGDARDLNLPDSSVDAVVLLGPLYHLRNGPTGPGAARSLARRPSWWPSLCCGDLSLGSSTDGVVAGVIESYPRCWRCCVMWNSPAICRLTPDGSSGYTHRPAELMEEIAEAELALEDLVGVEGMPLAASDMLPAGRPCRLAGRARHGAGRRTRS